MIKTDRISLVGPGIGTWVIDTPHETYSLCIADAISLEMMCKATENKIFFCDLWQAHDSC